MNVMEFLDEKKPVIDSVIKSFLPERLDKKHLEWIFGSADYGYDEAALNKTLAEPMWDLFNRGGKRWRPALFLLITEALGADSEKVKDFLVLPELAHNGSLIIDDIEDFAEIRRGKPCTHKLFGTDVAINIGNFMYFVPTLVFMKNRNKFSNETMLKAWEVFSQEMINIHAGQAIDIYWHKGSKDDIKEEHYLQMCAYKTGCLSRMAGRLAVVLSGGTSEKEKKIGKFCETIGIAFQIQDDILSASGELAEKKGYGNDITEGKRSLIVIHTLQKASPEDKKRLLEILSLHTRDEKIIGEAIEIINKHDSINYAKSVARSLLSNAWGEAEVLFKESRAKQKLKKFTEFLIERGI